MGGDQKNFSCQKFPIKKKLTEAKILPAKILEENLKSAKTFIP